ncbi:MAG TPA: hypothetical protein VM582_05630 [Candidatus Thermoplasmatota archaeon]|nr:hypothetical protein [Candidatus Thermoplasmatota archaeon]
MTRALALVAILLAASFAGCAEPAPAAPAAQRPVEIAADRPAPGFAEVATGAAAPPDLGATTAAPPELVPGEWWRIRFRSPFFEPTPDLVRVVADVTSEGYLVGMPHERWSKEAIAYHAPAFGDIGFDLSYAVHNVRFEPLRFPLVEGASWTTTFGGTDYVATVEAADAHAATVRFEATPSQPDPLDPLYAALSPVEGFGSMRLVYDARQHEVVRFESGIGTWEVVEHGYGFEGWVTVPRGIHVAIDHGQFLAHTPGGPLVARAAQVEGGFNRLTLLHGIFSLGAGAYRIRSVAPDGAEFVTEAVHTGPGLTVRFHEAADPDGTWTLEDVVAGAGGTYTMGMAYHQYDVRLPDGLRRSDHSHPVVR